VNVGMASERNITLIPCIKRKAYARKLQGGRCGVGVLLLCVQTVCAGILTVDPDVVLHRVDRRDLLGSNLALWHDPQELQDGRLRRLVRALEPTLIRIPGGSWSNQIYWNGHGVRDGDQFDRTRLKDGYWTIDYSEYAPGFRVRGPERVPSDFHGSADVLTLHQFVHDHGAAAVVTVNAGSGTPQMAAEWVRWANQVMGFNVRYWEIGNELDGQWELGHFLPDGSRMTGEVYAQRYITFAEAMKAVDPTIKIGGPASSNDKALFMEDLLRLAGEHVDFVSFHTYPVKRHLNHESEFFDSAFSIGPAMQRIHEWIETHQPARRDEIEIALTEWNSKLAEDRETSDLINGLWTCLFVGEMMRSGMSWATQWDLLTNKKDGGHGLLFGGKTISPKSQYWGLYLWSHYMSDALVASSLEGADSVYALTTRTDERLDIMLVNRSRDESARITLQIDGHAESGEGRSITFSQREYAWNYLAHVPLWSHPPRVVPYTLHPGDSVTVPPFSVRVLQVPLSESAVLADVAPRSATPAPALRLLLPDQAVADRPVEGWVLVGEGGADVDAIAVDWAELTIDGPVESDRQQARIAEGAGRFFLTPNDVGPVRIQARAGDRLVEQIMNVVPARERNEIVWRFEREVSAWKATSSFDLRADDQIRPNQRVAAVHLQEAVPVRHHDALMVLKPISRDVPRDRIAGVVLDVSASPDLRAEGRGAGVRVVLQSESDHWIPLGVVPLAELKGVWQTVTFRLPDPKYEQAVGKTYALRFLLEPGRGGSSPVNGVIYFDNVGFVLR